MLGSVIWDRKEHIPSRQPNCFSRIASPYADALIKQDNVYVVGEVILPISQTLMGVSGAKLEDIRLICSHVQGIAQSEKWRKMVGACHPCDILTTVRISQG